MARMMIDCRDLPSDSNCTLAIAGDDIEDLLDAAVQHAIGKHGHADAPSCARASAASSSPPTRRWPDAPVMVGLPDPGRAGGGDERRNRIGAELVDDRRWEADHLLAAR